MSAFCAPRRAGGVVPAAAPLRGRAWAPTAVLGATEAVAPALEIVDSRVPDWQITLPDTIADNASSGRWSRGVDADLAGAALPDTSAALVVNDKTAATGKGDRRDRPPSGRGGVAGKRRPVRHRPRAGPLRSSGSFTTAPFVLAGEKVEPRSAGSTCLRDFQ